MYVIVSGHTPTISALDCSFYLLVALSTWLSSRSTYLLKSLLRCGIYSSTFHQMYCLFYTKKVWANISMIFLTNIYNQAYQALYGISQYVLLWNSYFISTFSSELFAMTSNVKERKGIVTESNYV